MCNDFGHRVPLSEMEQAFSDIRLPLKFPAGAPNLEPRDDIWPTEIASVVRRADEGGAAGGGGGRTRVGRSSCSSAGASTRGGPRRPR